MSPTASARVWRSDGQDADARSAAVGAPAHGDRAAVAIGEAAEVGGPGGDRPVAIAVLARLAEDDPARVGGGRASDVREHRGRG